MDNDELHETIESAVTAAIRKLANKLFNSVLYGSVAVVVYISSIEYFSQARWVNKIRYSVWYSTDSDEIKQFQEKAPSDCDFFKAPMGDKDCHYEKKVEVQEPNAQNGNKRTVFVFWSKVEKN
jgi:hypothetical protein